MRDGNEPPTQRTPEDTPNPTGISEQSKPQELAPSSDVDSAIVPSPKEEGARGNGSDALPNQRWLFVLRHSMGLSLVSDAMLVNPFAVMSAGMPHRSAYMIGYLILIGMRGVVAGWRGYDIVTGSRKPAGLGFVCRTYATETGMAVDMGLTIILAMVACQSMTADGMLAAALLVGVACILMTCSDFAMHRVIRLACEREWKKEREREEKRKRENRKHY